MNFYSLLGVPSSGRALAGFLLSGFLFALLGALLPAWGYHVNTEHLTISNYFLSLSAGVVISGEAARRWSRRLPIAPALSTGCAVASAALIFLAFVPPPAPASWRMAALFVIGAATGLVNTGLFAAIELALKRTPAATATLAGIAFGLGCLASALLVAGTFYVYAVSTILCLVAVVPGVFALIYSGSSFPAADAIVPRSYGEAIRDFRGVAAVLLALLLFFQFCNEWSIAGWLPIFLIHRLGISPESSLLVLALYWLSLLLGRVAAFLLLRQVRHIWLMQVSAGAALFGCLLLLLTDNLLGACGGIVFAGFGFAAIYPLLAERIGERFPYYHPGFFNGIFSLAMAGGMLAPWAVGLLANRLGIWVVAGLPVLGTCMVVLLLILIWLERKVTWK